MPYCTKCGTQNSDDAKFCTSCGASMPANEGRGTKSDGTDFAQKFASINDTTDHTGNFESNDINNNKGISVVAYLGLVVLVPLFLAKESKYARFHTNQGLVLLIFELVCGLAMAIVSFMLSLMFLGILAAIINMLFYITTLALMIIGIVNAASGKAKELPLIGKIRILPE